MIRLPHLVPIVAACSLALVIPSRADAQFGGLMKKAKEKMTEKAAEKTVEQAGEKLGPVAPGEQLTDDLLSKVIVGATAAERVLADRDRVQASRTENQKALSALIEKNRPVHDAYNEGSSKISNCRDAEISALEHARNERAEKKMNELKADPNMMGKMQLISMKYAQRMQAAQQKNDAAALQKVQEELMQELTGEDIIGGMKKDTASADAKCGRMPAKPAALAQEAKLDKTVAAQDDSIRVLEGRAVAVGAQASGLEQVRYLQAKERAVSIMNRIAGRGAVVRYGDEEVDLVKKRQADLDKVKRAL